MTARELPEMLRAYLECALWAGAYPQEGDDDTPPELCKPWDDLGYTPDDFTEEAYADAQADCAAFLKDNLADLEDWNPRSAGHDFYLTRCGHGTGFWDRTFGTEAERKRLTDAAHVYGDVNPYQGDDGGKPGGTPSLYFQ